jgi:ribosome maturation factor RimP
MLTMKSLKILVAAVIALGVLTLGGSWVSASPDFNEIKGTLNAVDVPNLTVTVNGQDYAVRPTVMVIVEHQGRIPFEQLPDYIGRRVELKLGADGSAYKIEVKGQSEDDEDDHNRREIKGTLQGVSTENWTVTVNGKTYSVLSNAIIKVEDQGRIPFEKLSSYLGKRVELKLNTDGFVYKIEVKNSDEDDEEEDDD